MNLGKSAASFSESGSDRFSLDFLFEDAIYAVYFSLSLRSITHYGIHLVLGMNQGGNPFALVQTEIRDQLRVGFGAVANFKISVKYLFSKRNRSSATAL